MEIATLGSEAALEINLQRLGAAPALVKKLSRAGFDSVADLALVTADQVAQRAHLTPKAISQVRLLLSAVGLAFTTEDSGASGSAMLPVVGGEQGSVEALGAARRKPAGENDRAHRFASRVKERAARIRGPRLDDPSDRARLISLYNSVTMEVEDAAWIYGISRGAAYKASNENAIPTKKFPDRNRVITQAVFEEVFLEIPQWLTASRVPTDVAS